MSKAHHAPQRLSNRPEESEANYVFVAEPALAGEPRIFRW
jgi:hypothetical protein